MPTPPEPGRLPEPGRTPEPGRLLAQEEARRQLTTANIHLRRGQFSEAERVIQAALAQLPEDAGAHEMLGDVRQAQGRPEEARAAYREALAREPGRATAEAKLARAALRGSEDQRRRTIGVAYTGQTRALLRAGAGDDPRRGTRLAVFSALLPGLGQILDGALVKGAAIAAVYVLGWVIFGLTADRSTVSALGQAAHLRGPSLSGGGLFALALTTAAWLYAVVDAARAGK